MADARDSINSTREREREREREWGERERILVVVIVARPKLYARGSYAV